jgi:hypothetical protein
VLGINSLQAESGAIVWKSITFTQSSEEPADVAAAL